MQELSLDEIKSVELDILKKFDSICKENNLEYSIAYGTMLGAVRHKGFIPWDDDIDVLMKRKDYEKLLELKYDDGQYEIRSCRYSKNYYFAFSKMVDKTTYIDEIWRAENDMGVYIDIFPLDYLDLHSCIDDFEYQSQKILKTAQRQNLLAGVLGANLKSGKSLSLKYIARILLKILVLPIVKRWIINRIDLTFTGCESGEYVVQNVDGLVLKSDLFDNIIKCEFEGVELPIYQQYDRILIQQYGDYMTPPPVEEQKPKHRFKAYRRLFGEK